jgi:hypothetical protein
MKTTPLLLLLLLMPLSAGAAEKPRLTLKVDRVADGIPAITMTATKEPLSAVARALARELGIPVEVSEAAGTLPVTVKVYRKPLDLVLRDLAPQAYIDGILRGGSEGGIKLFAIHLSMAGEPAPSLAKLKQRTSDVIMFSGDTEDPDIDPLAGKLDVAYRNQRLRVQARSQALSVVAYRIADAIGIPLEIIGDSPELIDVSIADGSLEQVMGALTPSVRLYYRVDLATLRLTPVRMVVQAPDPPRKSR